MKRGTSSIVITKGGEAACMYLSSGTYTLQASQKVRLWKNEKNLLMSLWNLNLYVPTFYNIFFLICQMLSKSLIIYHANCYVLALISGGGSLLGGGVMWPTLQENSGILTDVPTENEFLGIYRGISEAIPRKHKIWLPRNFLGIFRRNSEENSSRRNIPTEYRGN